MVSVSVTGRNCEQTDSSASKTTQIVISYINGTAIPIDNKDGMRMTICTPRIKNLVPPSFIYLNHTTINVTTSGGLFLIATVVIGTNVSMRLHVSPVSIAVGYMMCFKKEKKIDLYAFPPDCHKVAVYCPFSELTKFRRFFYI